MQYLLDCDDGNYGCDGGWMTDAYDWTSKHGIVAWNDYELGYMGRQQTCKRPSDSVDRFWNNKANEEDMVPNDRLKELLS